MASAEERMDRFDADGNRKLETGGQENGDESNRQPTLVTQRHSRDAKVYTCWFRSLDRS